MGGLFTYSITSSFICKLIGDRNRILIFQFMTSMVSYRQIDRFNYLSIQMHSDAHTCCPSRISIYILIPDLPACLSHWSYCLSSSLVQPPLICPERGHVPHPSNASLFLRCHQPGHAACVCRCQYDGMCFDHATRKCVFSAIFPENHCQNKYIVTTESDTSTAEEISQADEQLEKKDLQEQENAVLKDNVPGPQGPEEYVDSLDFGPTPPFLFHPYNKPAQAFRQVAPANDLIVEDNSLFPAWAVALLAFCGVIVVMLVVLILY